MNKRRITMADIARRAGVHASTVSLAFRNDPSLPPRTRERIKALAVEMGYAPDPALGALVAYRRQMHTRAPELPLAYLTHWSSRFGWKSARSHSRFHLGAATKAAELGYKLEHVWLGEPGMTHASLNALLLERGIRGLILASFLPEKDRPLELDWTRFCAVRIDRHPHLPELHMVANDYRAIIQLAVRRTRESGYQRIGLVLPRRMDRFSDHIWSTGYLGEQQFLQEEDRVPILFLPDQSGEGSDTENASIRQDFEAWLGRHRPEVLIGMEHYVKAHLTELGLSVPKDIALVEFFLDPDGRNAGVRQNCERVGQVAVEILVGQLQQNNFGVPAVPTSTLVEGTWFDGASLPLHQRLLMAQPAEVRQGCTKA